MRFAPAPLKGEPSFASPLGEGDRWPSHARPVVERSPLRRGREQDGGFSRCGATPFLLAEKKRGKETAKGDLFRGGPLWTPSPTTKGAPPPLDPLLLDERRGFTGDDGRCPPPPSLPRPTRRLAVAIRPPCPTSAHHPAILPFSPFTSVPPRGALSLFPPRKFPRAAL